MALTIKVVYENAVLKPTQPLPIIQDGTRVWMTLHTPAEEDRVRRRMVCSAGRAMRKPCVASPSIRNSTFWSAHDVYPHSHQRIGVSRCQHFHLLLHPGPVFGPECQLLMERISKYQHFSAFTSTHVLSEVSHQLMILEAVQSLGWSLAGITARLQKHPSAIQKLTHFRQALDEIPRLGIEVRPVERHILPLAASLAQLHGLLTNDAITAAILQDQAMVHLASHDSDFDRVPGITRYAPV